MAGPSGSATNVASTINAGGGPSAGVPTIGRPCIFTSGALAGKTYRCELAEMQAATMCRKSGKRDRRTLDPPPVLSLSLFAPGIDASGVATEIRLQDYSNFSGSALGFVCHMDIFHIPGTDTTLPFTKSTQADGAAPGEIAQVGEHVIVDGTQCTADMTGATFVQASTFSWKQGFTIAFIFSDVSVHREGVYLPRYRCFNILNSIEGIASYPVLAETFGGLFRCYTPKSAPKLPASTELTNHLAKMGFSVNLRGEDERPSRKQQQGGGTQSAERTVTASEGKRKEEVDEQGEDGDEDDDSE